MNAEDANAVEWMQKGMNSPRHASTGVVSAREERCHHFSQYIKDMTINAPAPEASQHAQVY